MSQCKGHEHKGPNKDDVAIGTQKGRTEEKRYWKGPECKNGIMKRNVERSYVLEERGCPAASR
jgi:hypothetical protein